MQPRCNGEKALRMSQPGRLFNFRAKAKAPAFVKSAGADGWIWNLKFEISNPRRCVVHGMSPVITRLPVPENVPP